MRKCYNQQADVALCIEIFDRRVDKNIFTSYDLTIVGHSKSGRVGTMR